MHELLAALRAAGVPIGIDDELRLRVALSAALREGGDAELLGDVLRAVLVRSPQSGQRFEEVYALWCAAQARREASPHEPRVAPRPPVQPPVRRWWRWLLPPLLGLAAWGAWRLWLPPRGPRPPQPKPPVAAPLPPAAQPAPAARPAQMPPPAAEAREPDALDPPQPQHLTVYTATISEDPVPLRSRWSQRARLLLLSLAAVLGLLIYRSLRRKSALPQPALAPRRGGPPRVLPQVSAPERVLLSAAQEELLVWGIGRYVAEGPSAHLDLPATVAATAKQGGWLTLSWQRARHQREVWLWQDAAADAAAWSEGQRLSAEVERALLRAGLPLERAVYNELPERLQGPQGAFHPLDVEDRREGALVLLLSDGRWLGERLRSARSGGAVRALLRQLSGWPHLAFVDLARGARGLARLLQEWGIPVLAPEQVAEFLGGAKVLRPPPPRSPQSERRAWAAACALAQHEVSEAEALRLRQGLDLRVAAVELTELGGRRGPGGRLRQSPDERLALRRWLAGADGALLRGALAQHRAFLREEEKRRRAGPAPWHDTAAQRHLEVEDLLLRLWQEPAAAARALYVLYSQDAEGPLARLVQQELSLLAPRECAAAPDRVILPWSFGDLRDMPAQQALLRMGFAQGLLREERAQAWPGRSVAALGLCAGLGLAAGLCGLYRLWQGSGEPQVIQAGAVPQPGPSVRVQRAPGAGLFTADSYRVVAFTPQQAASLQVAGGRAVRVTWQAQELPCRTDERWLCGDTPPARLPAWERRSLALILGPLDQGARLLATRLLDSGSASVVLFGERGLARLPQLLADVSEEQVILVVRDQAQAQAAAQAGRALSRSAFAVVKASDLEALADGLHFAPAQRPLASVWGARLGAQTSGAPERLALRGACPRLTAQIGDLKVVRVCGGLFEMGSEEGGEDDEKPPHAVRVSQLWVGQTEVNNRQYQRVAPGHRGRYTNDDLPVESVNHEEAQRFCQSQGLRLPTEAEWEFAARGVDGRRYPWGDQEPTPERAAFGRSFVKDQPDPVGRHPAGAGPFGTLDQAGNVWEWVADCYDKDTYKRRASSVVVRVLGLSEDKVDNDKVDNPLVRECQQGDTLSARPMVPVGVDRVVRGGSFDRVPRDLRSAFRIRSRPGDRDRDLGFRCVRGAGRQP